MKKRIVGALFFVCFCFSVFAQNSAKRIVAQPASNFNSTQPFNFVTGPPGGTDRCLTMPAITERLRRDKIYREFREEALAMSKTSPANRIPCDGTNTIVVPVAFHFAPDVITCGEMACIMEEVQDQLDVINMQFGDNTGSVNEANCPMAYQDSNGNSVASTGTCISFCLAEPPLGTAANIEPGDVAITVGVYDGGVSVNGLGAPGWDNILNIFVTSGNCLGIADGIPGAGDGDGVTVCAEAFGGADPSSCDELDTNATFGLGVTLTHEIGHYLGLFHTHNDFATGCVDNDVMAPGPFTVTDTPIQANASFGCSMACVPSCTPGDFEPTANFMSFTDDLCMSMFTEDQAAVLNFWAFELFGAVNSVCGPAINSPFASCDVGAAFEPADGFELNLCLDDGGTFQLTDMSSFPAMWNWTFVSSSGDLVFTPSSSTVANPIITFTGGTSGTIDITLEVCDTAGSCDSVTQSYTVNLLTGDDCPTTCDYTLQLTDTFGDGWNGASLEITSNGVPIQGSPFGTTFTAGASEIIILTLVDGETIDFIQTNGGFPVEEGFVLTDPFGNILFDASGGFVGSGNVLSIVASCTEPTCDDGEQNGSETDVDCGGATCDPCPVCLDGFVEIINEPFNMCMMPAGWSISATDGGLGDITFNQGPNDVPGGQQPSPGFFGCIAIVDDANTNSIGFGCIITPVIDMSQFSNVGLTFDWQNNDFAGDGDFLVEVFDGMAWVQVFIEEEDAFGTDEMISLAGFTNSDFQIRFCYDDEGRPTSAWGFGIDNIAVCGEQNVSCPSAIIVPDISGDFCDGSESIINATVSGNVSYTWTSSNPNVVFVDPADPTTSVEMSALTPCQIENADLSLLAVCDLDGTVLFDGVVSSVAVYPAPPADLTTLVIVNDDPCGDPILVDPDCAAFVTLTPDAANPSFPVNEGDMGTASYTISYAAPDGAPNCCPEAPAGGVQELVIDGSFEAGPAGGTWVEMSSTFGTPICDQAQCGNGMGTGPSDGLFWAWFGGVTGPEVGSVCQTITVPAGTMSLSLTFDFESIACDSPDDFVQATVDGSIIWAQDGGGPLCGVLGYTPQTVDLLAAGIGPGSAVFCFESEIFANNGMLSNFFIDNVSILAETPVEDDPCVVEISADYNCEMIVVVEEIPTMGEWGLMILGLLFMIVSVVAIREQKQILENV